MYMGPPVLASWLSCTMAIYVYVQKKQPAAGICILFELVVQYNMGLAASFQRSLEGKCVGVATAGETNSLILQIVDSRGEPCEGAIGSLLECELVSSISGSRARVIVERRGHSQYEMYYQPTIKGRHQLHVKLRGQHIRGSPFDILVKLPVEKLGAPILGIVSVKNPWGVAINQRGEVVVTEFDENCVSVFSSSGERLRSFGTRGSGQGQFIYPAGVAVDGSNNILVVDHGNNRIQKFTSDGQFLTAVGTEGSAPLQFSGPQSITVNNYNNRVYVADRNNRRVQVLNSDLTFSSSFGEKGSEERPFTDPCGVACDRSGNVYVVDCDNHRIQVFTAEGWFRWAFSGSGVRRGELEFPLGIAVDADDHVYVTEQHNNRVSVFTCDGQFVTSFDLRKGKWNRSAGIAVDDSGVVYVCDYLDDHIQLF